MTNFDVDKISGSLFGGALGDAIGRDPEFMRLAQIHERFGKSGYMRLPTPALVTDDTQMTVAVGEALAEARSLRPRELARTLTGAYIAFTSEPRRAPGATCMTAIAGLQRGLRWQDATVVQSKGCGVNMRVAPAAFLPTEDIATGVAQLQAAITHGHPTGLAAAELTALAIRWSAEGVSLAELPRRLLAHAHSQRGHYRHAWLGKFDLRRWSLPADEAMRYGWDQCIDSLRNLRRALKSTQTLVDPCSQLGGGWIAEEALIVALYCAIRFEGNPVLAISAAARTSGDSDSLAAITGNIVGARHGMAEWPTDWVRRIEYGVRLAQVAEVLATKKW